MPELWQACHTIYQTINLLHGSYFPFFFLPSMMSWGAVRVPSDSLVVSLRIRPVSRGQGKMFLGIPIAVSDGIMPSGASSFWYRCSGSDFHFLCHPFCLPIAQLTTALSPSSVIAAISTSCNRRLTIGDESLANRGSGCGSMDCSWTLVQGTSSHPSGQFLAVLSSSSAVVKVCTENKYLYEYDF